MMYSYTLDWRSSRTRTEPGRSLRICGISALPAGLYFSVVLGGALPLLAQVAGMSDRQLGLLMALPFATSLVQLITARLLHRPGRRKRLFIWMGYLSRTLWVPMALAPILFGAGARTAHLVLGFAVIQGLVNNVATPAWQSWLADLVPPKIRGSFFAWRGRIFSLSMLCCSLFVGWALPRSPDASNAKFLLLALFVVAGLLGLAEIRAYRKMLDPVEGTAPRKEEEGMLLIPLRNREYRTFLGFNFLYTFGVALLGPFLWKHFLSELRLDGLRTTLMLQTAPMVAAVIIGPLLGRVLDQAGAKPMLRIGIVGGSLLTLGWFFITPEKWLLGFLLAVVIQFFWSGVDQSNFVLLMRYASARNGSSSVAYSTIFNLTAAAAGALAGYFGGDLAQRFAGADWVHGLGLRLHLSSFSPYLLLLLLSCMLRAAAGFFFGHRLVEPSAADTGTVMRAVSHGFMASMQTTLLLPLRVLVLAVPRKYRPHWIQAPVRRPLQTDPEEE